MNRKKRKDRQGVSGVAGIENGKNAGFEGRIAPHGYASPDLDKYRRHVEHFDLSDAQKTDLLLAVWRIMQSFVDRAFGDDPVQQVTQSRERAMRAARPVIDLQPCGETPDDTADLSGSFKRHAADRDER